MVVLQEEHLLPVEDLVLNVLCDIGGARRDGRRVAHPGHLARDHDVALGHGVNTDPHRLRATRHRHLGDEVPLAVTVGHQERPNPAPPETSTRS